MMRERFLRSASLSHICWDDERFLRSASLSLICWDDRRAIATGFSVGVLIIEKVKKHKEQFKTPCVVQGLGTTWENWVSQSWSNIAM
jgi:hypothetical protein